MICADLNGAVANEVAAAINETAGAGTAIGMDVDVANIDQVKSMVDTAEAEFGRCVLTVSPPAHHVPMHQQLSHHHLTLVHKP